MPDGGRVLDVALAGRGSVVRRDMRDDAVSREAKRRIAELNLEVA